MRFAKPLDLNLLNEIFENYNKKKQLTIVDRLKGVDLKGKSYTPLFPYFKHLKNEKG